MARARRNNNPSGLLYRAAAGSPSPTRWTADIRVAQVGPITVVYWVNRARERLLVLVVYLQL